MNTILVTGVTLEFESAAEDPEAVKAFLKKKIAADNLHGLRFSIDNIAGLHIKPQQEWQLPPIPGLHIKPASPVIPGITAPIPPLTEQKKTLAISPQEASAPNEEADVKEAQRFIADLNRLLASVYRMGEVVRVEGSLLGPEVSVRRIVVDTFKLSGWHVEPCGHGVYNFSAASGVTQPRMAGGRSSIGT